MFGAPGAVPELSFIFSASREDGRKRPGGVPRATGLLLLLPPLAVDQTLSERIGGGLLTRAGKDFLSRDPPLIGGDEDIPLRSKCALCLTGVIREDLSNRAEREGVIDDFFSLRLALERPFVSAFALLLGFKESHRLTLSDDDVAEDGESFETSFFRGRDVDVVLALLVPRGLCATRFLFRVRLLRGIDSKACWSSNESTDVSSKEISVVGESTRCPTSCCRLFPVLWSLSFVVVEDFS